MKMRPQYPLIGVFIAASSFLSSGAAAGPQDAQAQDAQHAQHAAKRPPTGLVREVLAGTRQFRDVAAAEAQGWQSLGSCVSGPEVGAMGVHYVNGNLVGDGELDPRRPEALIYETKNNQIRLVGVEFIAIADAWHAANGPATPALLGQLFDYTGSPNRYGLPAFYSLHVWAWRNNPNGMFVNWNTRVSCEQFAAPAT